MNGYAYIKDGKVESTMGALPRVNGNVSNFNKMNPNALKARGYLPLERDNTPVPKGKKLDKIEYQIGEDKVVEVKTFKNLSKAETDARAAQEIEGLKAIACDVLKATQFAMLEDAPINQGEVTKYKTMRERLYGFIKGDVKDINAENLKQMHSDLNENPFTSEAVTV